MGFPVETGCWIRGVFIQPDPARLFLSFYANSTFGYDALNVFLPVVGLLEISIYNAYISVQYNNES